MSHRSPFNAIEAIAARLGARGGESSKPTLTQDRHVAIDILSTFVSSMFNVMGISESDRLTHFKEAMTTHLEWT